MNEPRLVVALRMLLIRRRVFDTARGRKAPSRSPHSPPTAKPADERTLSPPDLKGWNQRGHSPGSGDHRHNGK